MAGSLAVGMAGSSSVSMAVVSFVDIACSSFVDMAVASFVGNAEKIHYNSLRLYNPCQQPQLAYDIFIQNMDMQIRQSILYTSRLP